MDYFRSLSLGLSPDAAMIRIRVPCSSANLGPGFDVLGIALSLYLELHVSALLDEKPPLNCRISCEGQGASDIDLDPERNLITRVAIYLLKCHDINNGFPTPINVHIVNNIPLSRGLGSSAAAVIAGNMLGNEVAHLGLSKDRLLDYCLMVERHPDNLAPALFGGFVGAFLRDLDYEDMKRKEVPLSEVLPAPAGGIDTGLKPPIPPVGIAQQAKFAWAEQIKILAIIPNFEVSTADARNVLPKEYRREDVTFNQQRVGVLPSLLGENPPNSLAISEALRDRLHQQYREKLIPNLKEVLSLDAKTIPGLLGVYLSGAGPTVGALVTKDHENIAKKLITIFTDRNSDTRYEWKILSPAYEGATINRGGSPSFLTGLSSTLTQTIRHRI